MNSTEKLFALCILVILLWIAGSMALSMWEEYTHTRHRRRNRGTR